MNSILILELGNFGKVTFSLLRRFPNACYIKLKNNHTNEIDDFKMNNDDTVVNTTKLWKAITNQNYFGNIFLMFQWSA